MTDGGLNFFGFSGTRTARKGLPMGARLNRGPTIIAGRPILEFC
jgi:hypothetical protein